MSTAETAAEGLHDCRDAFSRTLESLAESDPRIVTVVSDSVGSSKLVNFRKRWPERMVNVGIAGQTVAGIVSAGGALLVWTGLALAWRRFRLWRAKGTRGAAQGVEAAEQDGDYRGGSL